MVCSITNDYWLGVWASSPEQYTNFSYYCSLYFAFAFFVTFFIFMRVFTLTSLSWYATRDLHRDMINRVLSAPINLYFDITPIGRIMNRFSKDLSETETELPYTIGGVLACFYITLSVLAVAVMAVYWILLVLPFMFYACYKIYMYSINAYRETTRVLSVTKSPILSFF
jgi:ABC-type multidrug transport system fused ATPase/permease subunit